MRYRILILSALVLSACVGHPADDEDDFGPEIPTIDPSGEEEDATDTPPETPSGDVFGPGLLLDFTATWCVNCPRMAQAIEEAAAERPGTIFPVSVHFHDDFSYAAGEALAEYFGIQAYPSLIVNLDKATLTTVTSKSIIFLRIDSFDSPADPCTLDLSYSGGVLHADVTAASAGSYKLGALLLEDGLVAPQTGGTDDYVHDNILRKILSADIFGEDLGTLESGAAVKKEFSVGELPSGSFHVVAYVTQDGLMNTAADITLP